jgi:hypothetical protein
LERENYEQMEQLSKVKGISAPPYDLHRKYLERLERLQMMTDLEKVEAYIQVKDSAKNDKKVLQRMKEELAKKKEENNDLKKKLEEKRKYSDKYEKLMREKATAMLELNQKLLNYDLKPR